MGIFQAGLVMMRVILGEDFPGGSYPGWEFSGGNQPGGNFPSGSFHVTEYIILRCFLRTSHHGFF